MERFSRTPHDAIFRQMLAQKEVARDFLQLYLPAQFLSICDLNTLQLASGSFIEEDLRSSYSDILYSLQTQHGAGYIYALIEHQSSPDKLMAFRLMRYTLAAMQRTIRCRWWCRFCFITAPSAPGHIRSTGSSFLTILSLPARCTAEIFRWWT